VLRPPVESGQYTSLRFTQRLADAGIAPSTGSVGDSFDNAVAESFFGTLKTELIYRHTWASRHDAELAIFAWIEGWYNPERLIAALGMHSPNEYEAAFYADTQNTDPDTTVKVGKPAIEPPINRGTLRLCGTGGILTTRWPVRSTAPPAKRGVCPSTLSLNLPGRM
jgi:hypothetical protein